MVEVNTQDLTETLEELRNELRRLSGRVAALEVTRDLPDKPQASSIAPPSVPPTPAARTPEPIVEAPISEDTLLVISAAVAAFLGERAHIRQIRLLRSGLWAQQGRVSIQASHYLHH